MADTTDTALPTPEPVRVSFDLPGRIARDYQKLVDLGVWLTLEDALQHAVAQSWRFERGSYHSIRLDTEPQDEGATMDDARKDDTSKAEG